MTAGTAAAPAGSSCAACSSCADSSRRWAPVRCVVAAGSSMEPRAGRRPKAAAPHRGRHRGVTEAAAWRARAGAWRGERGQRLDSPSTARAGGHRHERFVPGHNAFCAPGRMEEQEGEAAPAPGARRRGARGGDCGWPARALGGASRALTPVASRARASDAHAARVPPRRRHAAGARRGAEGACNAARLRRHARNAGWSPVPSRRAPAARTARRA